MFIFTILRLVSVIATLMCVVTLGYTSWQAIRALLKKEKVSFRIWIANIRQCLTTPTNSSAKYFLIVGLLATIATSTIVHQFLGIHDLRLKPEGVYCFYVEATNNTGKIYTLPAQIRVSMDYSDDETQMQYYVEKIFFSSGGFVETEDGEPAHLNKLTHHYDGEGNDWDFVLLNKHAYSPYVTETSTYNLTNILSTSIISFLMVFLIFVLFRKETED